MLKKVNFYMFSAIFIGVAGNCYAKSTAGDGVLFAGPGISIIQGFETFNPTFTLRNQNVNYANKKAPNFSFIINAGAGYYINDNLSVRLSFEHTFGATQKLRAYDYNYNNDYFDYTRHSLDIKNKINISSVISDISYEYPIYDNISPYVGFGIGFASVNMKTTSKVLSNESVLSVERQNLFSNKQTHALYKTTDTLCYRVGVGLRFGIGEKFSLDFGYKYSKLSSLNPISQDRFDEMPHFQHSGLSLKNGIKLSSHLFNALVEHQF